MKVALIAHTVMPEKLVAASAKLCYSASSIDTVMDGLTEEKTASFVDMLSEIGHESPTEHASFTFGIEGVSRALLAQLTRHRMASYSVQSQRYVAANQFEYVLPPEIASIPEAAEEYRRAMEEDQAHYDRLTALLKEKLSSMDVNVSESDFLPEGNPQERFVYVKSALADEAFDVFSQEFSDPRVAYAESFKDACFGVADKKYGYSILPFDEKPSSRIPSIFKLF